MVSKFPRQWMLIADLHLQKGYQRGMEETLNWFKDEFQKNKYEAVVFLGDSLHTRDSVNVGALQRLKELVLFFSAAEWEPEVHILVGNHDMGDKHDRKVNSPSVLENSNKRIFVHSEITELEISGQQVLFIPYHEDQSIIRKYLEDKKAEESFKDTIIMAHVAVDGTKERGFSNDSDRLCKGSQLDLRVFSGFRRAFAGHFHYHAVYGNFMYVGAPMMQNMGDADQKDRGYVSYIPEENNHQLHVNPYAVQFLVVKLNDVPLLTEQEVKYKNIRVLIPDLSVPEEELNRTESILRERLGAVGVNFKKPLLQAVHEEESSVLRQDYSPVAMAAEFISSQTNLTREYREELMEYISPKLGEISPNRGEQIFVGDISAVKAYNFLGIQGEKLFNFNVLDRGVWFTQGHNGAGKTTIPDAIAWCLFGETSREVSIDEVRNRKSRDGLCYVEVAFTNGHTVRRGRKNKKTELSIKYPDGTVCEKGKLLDTQKILESLLNVNWNMFQRMSMLNNSNVGNFFSATDKEKFGAMERLLGLDFFERIGDETKMEVKDLQKEIDLLKEQEKSLLKEIGTLESRVESLNGKVLHEKEKVSTIEDIEVRLAERLGLSIARVEKFREEMRDLLLLKSSLSADILSVEAEVSPLEKLYLQHRLQEKELSGTLLSLEEKKKEKKRELTKLEDKKKVLSDKIARYKEEILLAEERFSRLTSSGFKAEKDHLKTELSRLISERVEKLQENEISYKSQLEDFQEKIEERRSKREKVESKKKKIEILLKKEKEKRVEDEQLAYSYFSVKEQLAELERLKEEQEQEAISRENGNVLRRVVRDVESISSKRSEVEGLAAELQEFVQQPLLEYIEENKLEDTGAISVNENLDDGILEKKMELTSLSPYKGSLAEVLQMIAKCYNGNVIEKEKTLSTITRKLEDYTKTIDTLSNLERDHNKNYRSLKTSLERPSEEEEALQEKLEDLGSDNDKEILVADIDNKKTLLRDAEETHGELVLDMTRKEESIIEITVDMENARMELDTVREQCTFFSTTFHTKREAVEEKREKMSSLEQRIAIVQSDLDNVLEETNSYEKESIRNTTILDESREKVENNREEIVLCTTEIEEKRGEMADILRDVDKVDKNKTVVVFWRDVIGDYKKKDKSLFRKFCMRLITEEINKTLLDNLQLINGGERANLRCRINEDLNIERMEDASSVTFAQRSQGERKKTQLALLFSVMGMIIRNSSFKSQFLFVDELYDSLDEEGRDSVENWLIEYTRKHKDMRTFIITHMEADRSRVLGTIRVEKAQNGSTYRTTSEKDGRIEF